MYRYLVKIYHASSLPEAEQGLHLLLEGKRHFPVITLHGPSMIPFSFSQPTAGLVSMPELCTVPPPTEFQVFTFSIIYFCHKIS
jgi:hypothetical protein